MTDAVLVINAGSSSIKFAAFVAAGASEVQPALSGQISGIGTAPRFVAKDSAGQALPGWDQSAGAGDAAALVEKLVTWIDGQLGAHSLVAAGHRVVHGGSEFTAPTLIDARVLERLDLLVPLAPLHQPHNLAAIRWLAASHPRLPQVACFDTAFHSARRDCAMRFALPRALHDAGVRRYGFHGISYEYIARALRQRAPELHAGRVVVAHLGSGASLCAMQGGVSVDSTMGFTALDGLPMGTRCGSIDAGVLLFLLARGLSAGELEHMLYHDSGLRGVSGISNDMRALLASDTAEAAQAVDLFVYRAAREIAGMAAAMGGIDGLVFTAGIGENAPPIRARIAQSCAWLGVALDTAANEFAAGRISLPASRIAAWVIPTDEEQMIARHTIDTIGASVARHGKKKEPVHA